MALVQLLCRGSKLWLGAQCVGKLPWTYRSLVNRDIKEIWRVIGWWLGDLNHFNQWLISINSYRIKSINANNTNKAWGVIETRFQRGNDSGRYIKAVGRWILLVLDWISIHKWENNQHYRFLWLLPQKPNLVWKYCEREWVCLKLRRLRCSFWHH